MTVAMRVVGVKQLPRKLSAKEGRRFLREVQSDINTDRPRLVLDCSNLRRLDKISLKLLLCCLEEAMKRNGDVKLAGLPAESVPILERTGVGRLFNIYETTAEAVDSFQRFPMTEVSQARTTVQSQAQSESAA